jgi:hypothetical protein
MMIISCSESQQDTVKVGKVEIKESVRLKTYTLPEVRQTPSKDIVRQAPLPAPIPNNELLTDTTSVSSRNSIADVTFYDSTNFILTLKPGTANGLPLFFTDGARQRQADAKAFFTDHLKPGQDIPNQSQHEDWIILIILFSVFLYSLIRSSSKGIFPGVMTFFLIRERNDKSSQDIGGLFNWQSTILNLFSFLSIALFIYFFAIYHDYIPGGISGLKGYLISMGIIVTAVTFRHIASLIAGNISEQRDAFWEYLTGVYLSYRISAFILMIVVILQSYTLLLPARVYFTFGIIVLCSMYFIQVVRLFIIFINRNLSIFYFILYLCALEILPVGISVKYFTGLF